MKTNQCVCGALVAIALFALSVRANDPGKTMSVQVKSSPLRSSPAFIGKVIVTLSYGDRVETLEDQGSWTKVRAADATVGWMHVSALSAKRIVLKSGQETAQTRASGDELALAGKGFNSDVENEFKKQHRNIDFSAIDKMEKIRIAPAEMQAFLKEGGVAPKEGGAR